MCAHTQFLEKWKIICNRARKLQRQEDIGFLEKDNNSEWVSISPTFSNSKKKRITFIPEMRKLIVLLNIPCHPNYISKIGNMIYSGKSLTFASVLDSNLDYNHIKLDSDAQHLGKN
jgi:hypothetical protein